MASFQQAELERIKQAVCEIVYSGESGTGYLISANRIVTCWHVVDKIPPKRRATVLFQGQPQLSASIVKMNQTLDVAVLQFSEPVTGISPLQFGRAKERETLWIGFGFPGSSQKQGLPIDGTLDDLKINDRDGVDSLLVKSDKLSAGTGSSPHGFSGTPIVQGGLVIGHIKSIIPDPVMKMNAAFGVAYAARAQDFVTDDLLDGEPLHAPTDTSTPLAAPSPAVDFDVFLSASPDGLTVATELAEALRANHLRVCFSLVESVPGGSYKQVVESTLARSQVAVALLTPCWLQQSPIEADALWQRHQQTGFTVIPVLGNGGVAPAPWEGVLTLDLKGGGAAGPGFKRLLYAVRGEPAPFAVVKEHLEQVPQHDYAPELSLKTARDLIAKGNPRRALMALPKSGGSVEMRGVRALALSKSGKTKAAVLLLESMRDEAPLNGENSGILGGCYRRLYEKTNERIWLERALDAYRSGFADGANSYAGINTASILLELGQEPEAHALAQKILDAIGSDDGSDCWTPATKGEAWLILGDVDKAKTAYRRAAQRAHDRPEHRAVMRRGARRALAAIRQPRDRFDALFDVPRLVAFVGHGFDLPNQAVRFPPKAAPDAKRAIGAVVAGATNVLGFRSATTGGDTLVLEKLFEQESPARILLPCPVNIFLEKFVVLPERKFEVKRLLEHEQADVQEVDDPTDPLNVWGDFAPRLREHAEELAMALDETPMLLALWDRRPSFLETVIGQWQQQGWPIQVIELRDGVVV